MLAVARVKVGQGHLDRFERVEDMPDYRNDVPEEPKNSKRLKYIQQTSQSETLATGMAMPRRKQKQLTDCMTRSTLLG